MALTRETALEQLRTVLENVAEIKTATRNVVEFDDVEPDAYPIAIVVSPDDTFEQGPVWHRVTRTTIQIQVWDRDKTPTQLETLRKVVLRALILNSDLDNKVSSLFIRDLQWIDSFPEAQGFAINAEMIIVKEDFT